jgi:predicted esterase
MSDGGRSPAGGRGPRSPLQALEVLGSQDVMITPTLRHSEFYTMRGLLSIMWHEPPDDVAASLPTQSAIIACGGAMGGLLGPANGLYHQLGETWAARGVPVLRVDYRRPNDLDACFLDVAAAVQLAVVGGGAQRVIVMGHSFGGAVAVQVGVGLPEMVAGVVTFATQSAGCEAAAGMGGRPLLLFHGDLDEILPLHSSEMVCALAGYGELIVCEGDGHLLDKNAPMMVARLDAWIPETLGIVLPSSPAAPSAPSSGSPG